MVLAKRYTGSLGKPLVGVKPSQTVVRPIVAQCQDDSWIPTCEGAPFKLCLSGDFLLVQPQSGTVSNIPLRSDAANSMLVLST